MNKTVKTLLIIAVIILIAVLLYYLFGRKKTVADTPADQPHVESSEGASRWLELPAYQDGKQGRFVVTHRAQMGGRIQRNYTLLYDEESYAALWVAYPLCKDHISSGREETWGYDPQIPRKAQTSVSSGYGASEPTANYPKNFYARGHQIPNADRGGVPHMQAQTYFSSNMTPQIQNGFNGGIWAKLESAVRDRIPANDTLYVVTGAVFSRCGEEESVKTIVNKNDFKPLPVPNYYWKALLKVTRSAGQIADAQTIGFWLPHGDLKGHSYSEYVVSVDQIEQWAGLNLFPNLPDTIESSSEANDNWSAFQNF